MWGYCAEDLTICQIVPILFRRYLGNCKVYEVDTGALVVGCGYKKSCSDLGITLGFAKMFSAAIFKTYFLHQKDIWIAARIALF